MSLPRLLLTLSLASGLAGCGVTTEIVQVPFDLLSTTGDAASSASSGGEDSSQRARLEHFLIAEYAWLRRDAAAGSGESIATLAALLGRDDAVALGRQLQTHYAALFADGDAGTLRARLQALPRS